MIGKTLISAPSVEPVTIAEVMARLRLDESNQEPAPAAPVAALASPVAPGNVDNGAHRYLVVFGTAAGKTQAGAPSAVVTVADKTVNGKVTLSGIPLGGALVTYRELYRTAAGGSTYMLLATLADNTTTTYTDNISDASLGAGAPSTNTTDDPLFSALITSARTQAESQLARALVTQTWDITLDAFPQDSLELPFPPLQSVTSITYLDINGASQTLANTEYQVITNELIGRVVPAYGKEWPQTRCQPGAITVRIVAGYGNSGAVPQSIKNWMLLAIATHYAQRETFIIERGQVLEVPREFFHGLLDPYRVPYL